MSTHLRLPRLMEQTYFVSEKTLFPRIVCKNMSCSKTARSTYSLQTYADCHRPSRPQKKSNPFAPQSPSSSTTGDNKNDCERNASRRWLDKFRKRPPHLKVIIYRDGLSPTSPRTSGNLHQSDRCRIHSGATRKGDTRIPCSLSQHSALKKKEAT